MTVRISELIGRAAEIAEEIIARNGIWEAHDQGRLAYHMPASWHVNPHPSWHVNASDWQRGFDQEAMLSQQL